MIKLKMAELLQMGASVALLANTRVPAKTAYSISKFVKKTNEELTEYEKVRIDCLKKYAELDEEGNVKVDESNNALFISDENKTSYIKEMDDFATSTEIEFDIDPIDINLLATVQLSANDLLALDKLIK